MDLIKYYKSSKGEATKKSSSTAKVKISPSQQATPTVPVQNAGSHSVDLTLDSHIDDAKEIPSDKLLETSSQQAISAVPVQHGGSHLVEPALDSDVEEDDAKEIPSDELRAFMLLLRSTNSSEMMPHVIKFNATQYINCNYCKSLNSECKVNPTASRCQLCQTKKRTCSRTEYFKQWMCRHKFKISWTKAEEVVKRGWVLMRNANLVAPEEKTEADQASASAASTGVRTSSRIPVPRVRKEPMGITTSLEVHSRPGKRTLPSGPPRADRKRRKVTLKVRDPESHELQPEPKSEPEFVSVSVPNPVNGREILPAPQSDRKPTQSNASRFFKMPALESHEPTNIVRARRPDPRTAILSRLAETEKRLDALEARMRTTELGLTTRQHVVSELSGVIGQLENNRDLHGATSRLRALHASFLDEETGNVSADGGQDPNFDQIQVDDEQDDNITPDEAFDDLEGLAHVPNGNTSILVEEPPFLDATVDAPTRAFTAVFNDDTSSMIENDPESPILPQGQASDDPVTAT